MIGITRRFARKAAICGFLGLAVAMGAAVSRPEPAMADYQTGVDAYYRGDFAAALEAWRPLADAGDAVAQNSIGALYDHGLGVQEDNFEAARWYEMAAQQGLPLAMRNLGNQYATGHGLPYDVDMARQWYERAAALGDQQSVSLLRQLRPSTAPAAAAAAPTFVAPTTTGSVAVPAESTASESTGQAATAAPAPSAADSDLVITGMESGNTAAETAPAAFPEQGVALDIGGGETVTMPATGSAVPAAPAQPAAPTQQAAIAVPPAAPRSDGNWLIGQWQGPSLGCPKGGGIEFTESETLSWFDGEVAVRMSASYQITGDNIVVTSTASDGSGQTYTYQRNGADRMIIVTIPDTMPKSMIGIAYRRCGPATTTPPAPIAAQPGIIEIPTDGQIPAAPAPATTTAATAATPAAAPAVAPAGATAADGWAAFERGDPQQALAIFKALGDAGDSNMQVLVGQMYDFGQGIPQDDVEALKWYQRAAEAGNAKGQYQTGVLYFRSQGVPQNLAESYRWLTLASEGKAQGLEVNPNQAVAIQAKSMLNDVTRQMSDDDMAKAKQLLKSTN
ncbi:tetratricopeptide repeat protein [Dongia sp.]|uniref:tetratricopeptide repeat protein n=1 Tax=Dongia sp. TaxID=1977262 RepID=UPI0035AECBD0